MIHGFLLVFIASIHYQSYGHILFVAKVYMERNSIWLYSRKSISWLAAIFALEAIESFTHQAGIAVASMREYLQSAVHIQLTYCDSACEISKSKVHIQINDLV